MIEEHGGDFFPFSYTIWGDIPMNGIVLGNKIV